MQKIYCSTGALVGRPNKRDYRLLKGFADQLSCDGFELLVYDSWYPEADELISTLKSFGLSFPVVHCEKAVSEKSVGARVWYEDGRYHSCELSAEEDEQNMQAAIREFGINLKIANGLGAQKMVFHMWNGLVSDKNIEKNVERFGIFKEMAEEAGVLLMAENVVCNTHDPLSDLELAGKEYPDIAIVYDTKMAEFHGQTMDLFGPEHEWMIRDGHIKHLHINDYNGGIKDWGNLGVLPIGKGHVDFDRFFSRLKEYDYKGDYTVEATAFDKTGQVDIDMLNECFGNLRRKAGIPVTL